MATTLHCPSCKTMLGPGLNPPAGQEVQCQKCRQSFLPATIQPKVNRLWIGLIAGAVLMLGVIGGMAAWTAHAKTTASRRGELAHSGSSAPAAPAYTSTGAAELASDVRDGVQRATVFVIAQIGEESFTGSGFIVKSTGDTAWIVTSCHVISDGDALDVEVSVILNPGLPDERTIPKADIVASDAEADLALIRVVGASHLPPALELADAASLEERMPAYIFGFPGGVRRISMGRARVSQLRRGDRDEIVDLQINGELNPGNSGGPVVDVNGRVIGVAASAVLGKNVGWAVPAGKLKQMLQSACASP